MDPLNVLYELGEPRWSEVVNMTQLNTQFSAMLPLLNTIRNEVLSMRGYLTLCNLSLLMFCGIAFFILESVNRNRHSLDSLKEDAAYNRESIEEMYRLLHEEEDEESENEENNEANNDENNGEPNNDENNNEEPSDNEDHDCEEEEWSGASRPLPEGHMRVTLETENDYEQFIVCGRTGQVVERMVDDNDDQEGDQEDQSREGNTDSEVELNEEGNSDENNGNEENEPPSSVPVIPCRCGNEHYYEFYSNGTYYCSVECMI